MHEKSPKIHPEMHEVTVIFTNGQEMKMRLPKSRYTKDVLHLQSDPKSHRAWNEENRDGPVEIREERARKIAEKFMKFDF